MCFRFFSLFVSWPVPAVVRKPGGVSDLSWDPGRCCPTVRTEARVPVAAVTLGCWDFDCGVGWGGGGGAVLISVSSGRIYTWVEVVRFFPPL